MVDASRWARACCAGRGPRWWRWASDGCSGCVSRRPRGVAGSSMWYFHEQREGERAGVEAAMEWDEVVDVEL